MNSRTRGNKTGTAVHLSLRGNGAIVAKPVIAFATNISRRPRRMRKTLHNLISFENTYANVFQKFEV